MADRIAVMNAGEIVQIGAPEQLYNRPQTRFVADFLGEANFLEGHAVAVGDQLGVATDLAELRCADPPKAVPGGKVVCCVRPEHIVIEPDGAAPSAPDDFYNRIPARIVGSIYLGEIRQYTVALGANSERLWRVSLLATSAPRLNTGEFVRLCFSQEHTVMLQD